MEDYIEPRVEKSLSTGKCHPRKSCCESGICKRFINSFRINLMRFGCHCHGFPPPPILVVGWQSRPTNHHHYQSARVSCQGTKIETETEKEKDIKDSGKTRILSNWCHTPPSVPRHDIHPIGQRVCGGRRRHRGGWGTEINKLTLCLVTEKLSFPFYF